MQPFSKTLFDLFGMPIEYAIPIFQRRYVWNRERQWEKLWADVVRTSELQLASPASGREHFLGAIIVRAENPTPGGVAKWSVIDGQQRLTTFQILLDAAELAIRGEADSSSTAAAKIHTLIENPEAFRDPDDPNSWLKLKPGGTDLQRFINAMGRSAGSDSIDDDDLIGQAHEYFRRRVSEWVRTGNGDVSDRADALAETLLHKMRVISITIDSSDHPNWIFETLNARGTPLQAWDLVKNYLLFEEKERGGSDLALYQEYLAPVEADGWWATQTQTGSHDIDLFLFYWLIMRTRKKVSLGDVYGSFREHAIGKSPTDIAADISASAERYRTMMTGGLAPNVDEHLRRWRALDIGVSSPIVLWLMQNCSNDVLERALRALESFFVRRMVSGIGVAGLNTWFPRVIEQLEEGGASDIDRRLICTLANGQRETRRWPDDSQFGEALIETPLYERLSPRPRLRTILEALESEMGGKLAPVALKEGLTIEHIMPQNWRKNWPIEKKTQEAQIEAEERRDLIIHTLGNLTLCTSSLGSQMSDGPWKDKKPALRKFGLMMLTNQALEIPGRGWTEKKIRTRSLELANLAVDVWPSPASLLET